MTGGAKSLRSFLLLLSLVTVSFLLLSWTNHRLDYKHLRLHVNDGARHVDRSFHVFMGTGRDFLLDTPYCKIPDIDPFDPSTGLNLSYRGEIRCQGKPSITFTNGSVLRINRTRIELLLDGDFKYCHYQPISRGPKNSDFSFVYGELSKQFDYDILVPPQDEFFRIYCYSQSDGRISTNFHATVAPKEDVEHTCDYRFRQHKKKVSPQETYNVHMIGVDSVSRLNFLRRMPLTHDFLQRELQAFPMFGYNKVADNTFVNIVPMMTGKFVSELGWNETMQRHPFDEYNFFWKNFSKAGYRTLYAEDAPKIAIFVYGKEGFHQPPADYYNRPLALAIEKHKSVWSQNHHCIVDRLETTMLLDYVTDFSRVFSNKPHFGFTFITRLTHDSLNLASSADSAYVNFLQRFKSEGHLNNTIIFLYSDHGYRFGANRSSYVGKVEERLPFMYLIFPPSFHEKYPKLVRNLRTNSRRLTTPFDIYETLKDILNFDGVDRKADVRDRGISLLREIPAQRTCGHAWILPHWCLCLEQKAISPKGRLAREIGQSAVREINHILMPASHLCAQLRLENISDVVRMQANDQVLRFADSFHDVINVTVVYGNKTEAPVIYQVTLSTSPGHALFEATLVFHPVMGVFKLGGDVSRINAYNDQSACVDNFRLKKFCYCVK